MQNDILLHTMVGESQTQGIHSPNLWSTTQTIWMGSHWATYGILL